MAEEIFISKYDGTMQDNLLEFAENVKKATTVDGAETVNVQGFSIPRISDISGFIAVDNAGKAVGFMAKEQVASVLRELLPIVSPHGNGLMPKEGFIEHNDIADANTLFNGYTRGSIANSPFPEEQGMLVSFLSGGVALQIFLRGWPKQLFWRSYWDNWGEWNGF